MRVDERKLFGRELKESRMAAGLTLRALAERAGVQFSNISAIESGRVIAGAKQAAKLVNGLDLKGRKRERLLLAASLSSRRTNPGLEKIAPERLFLRSLPWLLKRLGLSACEGCMIINLCRFPELPKGHPPLLVIFEDPSLNSAINNSKILNESTKQHLRANPAKHYLALIVRNGGTQALIECGVNIFS
jgi:transcriptional regulator with XRE-family HTH domain